jgi:hypothetical protein
LFKKQWIPLLINMKLKAVQGAELNLNASPGTLLNVNVIT